MEKLQANRNKSSNKPKCSISSDLYNQTAFLKKLVIQLGDKSKFKIICFLNKDVYEITAQQSKIYAQEKTILILAALQKIIWLSLKYFLLSGHHRRPRQEFYWSLDPSFTAGLWKKQHLHFNDNFKIPKTVPIRPLIACFNRNFMKFGYLHCNYSVDEKIVGYFGRQSLKRFVRGKPIEFGFKEWTLYTYIFSVYQGVCQLLEKSFLAPR